MVHTRSRPATGGQLPSLLREARPLPDGESSFALITDRQLRIVRACPGIAQLSGYDRSDLPGRHFGHLVEESHRHRLLRAGTLALAGIEQEAPLVLGTVAGVHLTMHVQVQVITWKDETCLLWVCAPAVVWQGAEA